MALAGLLRQGMFCLAVSGAALPAWSTPDATASGKLPQEARLIPLAVAVPLPDRNIHPEELEQFIDGVMTAQFAGHKLAGAAIVVVKDGDVLLEKGYGFSDLDKAVRADPAETRFSLGSISKLMVWTAVMQLAERGQLDLDADVNRYLVKFKVPATYPAPITMRNLMTHTAGFEDIGTPFAPRIFRSYPSLGDFLADHLPARVMPPVRDFAHGARPYSNWGALLAAHVVECVSGQVFADYATRHIFQPLGMSKSDFASASAPAAGQRALGYASQNGRMVGLQEDMSSSGPAGALQATVDDIGRFMIAHLENGALKKGAAESARILSEQSVQAMHRRSAQSSPWLDGMALGFMDAEINGRRALRHDGSTRFTHSELTLIPESHLGLFVTYNSQEGGYARRELRQAFFNRYLPAELPRLVPPADFSRRAAEYAGSYRSLRRSFTTFEKLLGSMPITVRPQANGTLLVAGDQWTQLAPDVFRNALGERIVFEREQGRVVALSLKSSLVPAEKIHWYQNPSYHALALLMILASAVGALVAAIRRVRAGDAAPVSVVRARRLLTVMGLLNIVVVALLVSVFAGGVAPLMTTGIPTRLYVGLVLGMVSAVLTLLALVFVVRMLWDRHRARAPVAWPVVHTVLALGFVAFLYYWNLLGFHLG